MLLYFYVVMAHPLRKKVPANMMRTYKVRSAIGILPLEGHSPESRLLSYHCIGGKSQYLFRPAEELTIEFPGISGGRANFQQDRFAILKSTDLKDASERVFPSFWLGALFGGALFGTGMVLAGGCGAGSLWRAGEGHVKLWVAVFFFAASASIMRQLLVRTNLIAQLGDEVFLPSVFGWTGAVWVVAVLMIIWYLLSGWNEQRKRTGVLQL